MKYKGYNISDAEIDKLMDKLDISLEEACETILSDREVIENETVNELSKKATKNRITSTIHEAKGEKKERKAREKKENPLKKEIIQMIYTAILENLVEKQYISIRNDEKYIDFIIGDREFTVNLVEHRKKK